MPARQCGILSGRRPLLVSSRGFFRFRKEATEHNILREKEGEKKSVAPICSSLAVFSCFVRLRWRCALQCSLLFQQWASLSFREHVRCEMTGGCRCFELLKMKILSFPPPPLSTPPPFNPRPFLSHAVGIEGSGGLQSMVGVFFQFLSLSKPFL